jgi:hypothetical protein
VNRTRITRPTPLRDGDVIHLGPMPFRVILNRGPRDPKGRSLLPHRGEFAAGPHPRGELTPDSLSQRHPLRARETDPGVSGSWGTNS